MHNHVKYWILPDIENRIKNREIAAYFKQYRRWRSDRTTSSGNSRGPVAAEERFRIRHDWLSS